MATTTKKLQLKIKLSDGKNAVINLPEAKDGLNTEDLISKFSILHTAYASDLDAYISNIELATVVTTTNIITDCWRADTEPTPY